MHTAMFAAVFTVSSLFVFAAATGSSTANLCTATLPPAVTEEGGDQCPTLGAAADISDVIKQNVSTLLQEVVRCKHGIGSAAGNAASSCAEIAELEPDSPSGNYWILNSTGSPVQVFCSMTDVFGANLPVTRGWVRVATLNMTNPDQQCPENFRLYTDPIRVCGNSAPGCNSVIFTTHGLQYRQVCGRVRGYQYNSPDAFSYIASNTSDGPYVHGISFTHGNNPRKHIWTYAAGHSESTETPYYLSSCPCTGAGAAPPSFVGSDYYCEAALPIWSHNPVLYVGDPLWDGQGCDGDEGTCCDPPNLPWFCKELPEPTTDYLEVRICTVQSLSDEDVRIDLMELYMQ